MKNKASTKNPGRLLKTEKGLYGITRNSDALVNGKLVVELWEVPEKKSFPHLNPIFKDGKPAKVLCSPENITIIGYVD